MLANITIAYTEFNYTDIEVRATASAGPATGDIGPGGPSDLFDKVAFVSVKITNSGSVEGAEVAQLYLSYPNSAPETPLKQLRGFDKLKLAAGASGIAEFSLRKRDLAYWDTKTQNWVVPAGTFGVGVGASSRDIRQEAVIEVS